MLDENFIQGFCWCRAAPTSNCLETFFQGLSRPAKKHQCAALPKLIIGAQSEGFSLPLLPPPLLPLCRLPSNEPGSPFSPISHTTGGLNVNGLIIPFCLARQQITSSASTVCTCAPSNATDDIRPRLFVFFKCMRDQCLVHMPLISKSTKENVI